MMIRVVSGRSALLSAKQLSQVPQRSPNDGEQGGASVFDGIHSIRLF